MRNLLFLLMLVVPVSCTLFKKPPKKKGIPVSRWIENKRMKLDSTLVAFEDTAHLEFLPKSVYIFRRNGGFIYKDTFKFYDSILDFKMFTYTIRLRKYGKLVLKDDSMLHVYLSDPYAPSLAGKKIVNGMIVEPYAPVTSIDQMVGHWSEYKRVSKTEMGTIEHSRTIKSMDITGGSTDGKLGFLYSSLDDKRPSWYIKAFANQLMECDGTDKRQFKIIKCEKNDLIMEEDNITYYFKQFK